MDDYDILQMSTRANLRRARRILDSMNTTIPDRAIRNRLLSSFRKNFKCAICVILLSLIPMCFGVWSLINSLSADTGYKRCHYYDNTVWWTADSQKQEINIADAGFDPSEFEEERYVDVEFADDGTIRTIQKVDVNDALEQKNLFQSMLFMFGIPIIMIMGYYIIGNKTVEREYALYAKWYRQFGGKGLCEIYEDENGRLQIKKGANNLHEAKF